MRRPFGQFVLWLLLAVWFAAGIARLHTPAELTVYQQVRTLARLGAPAAPETVTTESPSPDTPAGTTADPEKIVPVHPGAAVLALPFYVLGRFTAIFQSDDPAQPFSRAARITALAAPAAAAAAIIFLALTVMNLGLRPGAALLLSLTLALASPLVIFGSRLESPAFGLFVFSLIFFAVSRIRLRHELISLPFLAGLGLGLLPFFGDAYWIAWPFLLVWTLLSARRLLKRPRYAALFFVPFLGCLLLLGLITKGLWGGFWRFPDGLPFWRHFAGEYFGQIRATWSFVADDYLPALGVLLFNNGPLPKALAAPLPEAARGEIFLGLFCRFPLLATGLLGAFAMQNDRFTRSTIRWLFLLFWLVLLLWPLSGRGPNSAPFDLGGTAAAWFGALVGLGFFIQYHLYEMHGLLWKNLLRLVFLAALAISLAHPWIELATANIDAHIQLEEENRAAVKKPAPTASAPAPLPSGPLPVGKHDALLASANRLYQWLSADHAAFFAAFRPGVKSLPLYGSLLAAVGFLLVLLDWVLVRRPSDDERIAREIETIRQTRSLFIRPPEESAAPPDDSTERTIARRPDADDTQP